jgi:hypothetical protein
LVSRRYTLAVCARSTQFFDSRRKLFVGLFCWYAAENAGINRWLTGPQACQLAIFPLNSRFRDGPEKFILRTCRCGAKFLRTSKFDCSFKRFQSELR